MNVYILQMLYFDRIDVSEGIDVNKTSASEEYNICYYSYFLNYSLSFNQMSPINAMIYWWCLWTLWGHKPNAKRWFDQKSGTL